MNERNVNIDLAKSLACLGILGLHCIGYVNYTLYYICTFAVPVFFMVNGYLMFSKKEITLKYAGQKALSVMRIIILWNLIICIPMMILKHKFINPLDQILKSLIQQGYLWHFWFFGTLLILYLLLPILHKLTGNPRYGLKIHILLCVVFFVLCIANTIYSFESKYPMCLRFPQSLRLWVSIFYYLAGGLFARIKTDSNAVRSVTSFIMKIPTWALGIMVLVLGVVCNYGQKHLGVFAYQLRAAEYFYDELTVIAWCLTVFAFIVKLRIPEHFNKCILGFSKLSLGIFIVHPLLLKASEYFLTPKTTPQAVALWGVISIMSFGISLVISKIPFVKRLIEL